ncbi:hypothetical protein GGX14DRAFT_576226 [Mycena pura]|uniref:Uncharacterized protein n=1 Tax=Mycena pura TaxID=153505 RepID=A0AAD6Y7A0_9AGAR|nr:hypothetical protein GGX14DRAFT_576226 [Mycena pura]
MPRYPRGLPYMPRSSTRTSDLPRSSTGTSDAQDPLRLAPSSSMKGTIAPRLRGLFERCTPMGGFDQCAVTSDFEIDDDNPARPG